MSEGVVPSSLEAALASHRPNFNHQQQEPHIHNTVDGQELDPNSRLQSYSNIDLRYSQIYYYFIFASKLDNSIAKFNFESTEKLSKKIIDMNL